MAAARPIHDLLAGIAGGRPPSSDGEVEVLPSLGPAADDVVLATDAHLVISCDVPPPEVGRHFPTAAWSHPASLLWLCHRTGRQPRTPVAGETLLRAPIDRPF